MEDVANIAGSEVHVATAEDNHYIKMIEGITLNVRALEDRLSFILADHVNEPEIKESVTLLERELLRLNARVESLLQRLVY